jgi:mannose-6-phosphate isomerase-like protein (cupin superfamily)|tara:strand:- start:131 stop:637 length:507 start_codon:yes stop_codon:yes gene_type:complete
MRNVVVAIFLIAAASFPAGAQESGAPPAIYKPGADIIAELDRAAATSASAGGWSVSVSPGVSVRRRSSAVPQFAIVHPFSVEIYRILEGSGTLVTGGFLELPLAESTNPNLIRTERGIRDGLARQVREGDILVLQPGTPHWFRSIDGDSLTYMESRIQITTHPVQFQP